MSDLSCPDDAAPDSMSVTNIGIFSSLIKIGLKKTSLAKNYSEVIHYILNRYIVLALGTEFAGIPPERWRRIRGKGITDGPHPIDRG